MKIERVQPGPIRRGTRRHSGVLTIVVLGLASILVLAVAMGVSDPVPPGAQPTSSIGQPITALNPDAEGWGTWYDDPTPPAVSDELDGYGAVPTWSFGDEPYVQHVCGAGRGTVTCVDVLVQDFCACGDRHGFPTIIDLSSGAFERIADLSRGVIHVRFGNKPWPTPAPDPDAPTLPPTDIQP